LGIMPEAIFPILCFQMSKGDRLVLISDGIVEAMDANRRLFGFERVHDLLRTAKSAAELAGAAQRFGQEDDISVISVARAAAHDPALA